MPSTRIPSPARSQGAISTPRREKLRRTRSVSSPAHSDNSVKLTAVISNSFVTSPLPKRRSVLTDDTAVETPRRKSWWKKLDENFTDVMEVLENKTVPECNNVEEYMDVEILSQEKKNFTFDLPESSDGESINSIVIPQRKLFNRRENLPQKNYEQIFDNRETLAKLQKSNLHDNELDVRPKNLFSQKSHNKPAFPAALLNISTNKTIVYKAKEKVVETTHQVRNLFGNRPGTKRKNMFTDFILSDSEDEIPEIQPKVFGFRKNEEIKQQDNTPRKTQHSPTSSFTDIDIDDWKLLPSSTMLCNQLDEVVTTPSKRARLSKLSEAKESQVTATNTSKDKTKTLRNSIQKKSDNQFNSSDGFDNNSKTASRILNYSRKKSSMVQNKSVKEKSFGNKVQAIDSINENEKEGMISSEEVLKSHGNKSEVLMKQKKYSADVQLTDLISNNSNIHSINPNESKIQGSINKNKSLNEKSFKTFENISDNEKEEDIVSENIFDKSKSRVQVLERLQSNASSNILAHCDQNNDNDDPNAIEEEDFTLEYENDEDDLECNIEQYNESNTINHNNRNQDKPVQSLQDDSESQKKVQQVKNDTRKTIDAQKINVHTEVIPEKENRKVNDQESQKQNTENLNSELEVVAKAELVFTKENVGNKSEYIPAVLDTNKSGKGDVDGEKNDTEKQIESEANVDIDPGDTEKNREAEAEVEPPDDDTHQTEEVETDVNKTEENVEVESEGEADVNESEENVDVESEVETDVDETEKNMEVESEVEPDVDDTEENEEVESEVEPDINETEKNMEVESELEPDVDDTEENEEVESEVEPDVNETEKNMEVESELEPDDDTEEKEEVIDGTDKSNEKLEQDGDSDSKDGETEESEAEANKKTDISVNQYLGNGNEAHTENQEETDKENDNHIVSYRANEQNETENYGSIVKSTPKVANVSNDYHRNIDETRLKSPEAILHNKANQVESFRIEGRNTSVRKTKSMIKNPSLAPIRTSTAFSDGTRDSSAEGSGWDSHRTTRKTLRQTFGKDFTLRKSLRTLVMEQSTKRQTDFNQDFMDENPPPANSTEFPAYETFQENEPLQVEETVEAEDSSHDTSKRTRQTTLEIYLENIKKRNMEKKIKMEEEVRNSLKARPRDPINLFKVPLKPIRRMKPVQKKSIVKPSAIPLDMLPAELIEDMKYKPPKRFQPNNASWITKRLYKFLENKLEPKYDYKARVRAEKLVQTMYTFTKEMRRHEIASVDAVDVLKHEMARLEIVKTHFDFYEFFNEFMPREIRIKVVPDLVNKISLPRHGIFTDILR